MKPEDWEYIRNFAFDLIKFSSDIRDENDITKQRIIILLLDQSTELLMKSFLIKEGTLRRSGNKNIYWCLNRITTLGQEFKDKIILFHKLRNKIQHTALGLEDINKPKEIIIFWSALKELYNCMFNDNRLPELFPLTPTS